MGLFSWLKKSPEKLEAAGDAYITAGHFGPAKLEYESALEILEKKHSDDRDTIERVSKKLKESKESLAREHLENSGKLIEAQVMDEASKLLTIALSLTEDPLLETAIREKIVLTVADTPGIEPIEDDTSFESYEDVEEDDDDDGEYEENEDKDHAFEVLCMTMPDEIAEAYQSYGEHFKAGYLALSSGDFQYAADELEAALAEHPASHIPVELATARINLGQADSAILLLTGYLEKHPESLHGISLLCELYCDLKQFDIAHDVIKRLPESVRKSTDIIRLDGRIYFHDGNYSKAEEIFTNVLKATDHDTDVARELAMTLAAAGKTEEARSAYAGLLNECTRCRQRLNPMDKKAYADLSFELGDASDKILDIFLTLGKEYPELRTDCYIKASAIFQVNGNEKEAARFKKMAR